MFHNTERKGRTFQLPYHVPKVGLGCPSSEGRQRIIVSEIPLNGAVKDTEILTEVAGGPLDRKEMAYNFLPNQ